MLEYMDLMTQLEIMALQVSGVCMLGGEILLGKNFARSYTRRLLNPKEEPIKRIFIQELFILFII